MAHFLAAAPAIITAIKNGLQSYFASWKSNAMKIIFNKILCTLSPKMVYNLIEFIAKRSKTMSQRSKKITYSFPILVRREPSRHRVANLSLYTGNSKTALRRAVRAIPSAPSHNLALAESSQRAVRTLFVPKLIKA